ncbi:hypothetical protein [Mycobacteroides abscessus]|uniref:hypothetical protein n=1 Tax=Mycobacteroides abscessus TaxID=36809 RepID=UPI00092691B5|nr:hypothetical protein [Mycobacteroides abscessus]SKS30317.1 bacteriophage protein [Mycobacteroides abscessus subsp. abscessus]SHU53489.1 bacteriophage protein [Mycobacteroides abscessus subsp. bolletii]SHW62259.1 bacteriophage protein [Mycobacteroides abscessus subsp. bolletii]SHW90179.1 bacteriophage protein [Mycobacteroides abscessus subsp. bolletii]SHX35406.1 bacteriophage protein [Mycobacteroides abscessus subsp. bolletii]
MTLRDEWLKQPALPEEHRRNAPKFEFDGSAGYVTSGPLPADEQPPEFDDLLRTHGYDPTRFRIVGLVQVRRWQNYHGDWLAYHRFNFEAIDNPASGADLEQLIREAQAHKSNNSAGPHWFVFQAADLQIGKRSRDGSTEQIIDQYVTGLDLAIAEYKSAKYLGVEGIQVSMPGDCIEGNQSQSGRNLWLTQETITEQTRIFRRLIMHTVEQLAPLTDRLYVDVVNGNHDEAQRIQNTYPGNGWATESAIAVADALTLNPAAFSHVTVRVPDKWSGSMTVPVGDTVVTVAHGHQWSRAGAMAWWQRQAFNGHPPAGAHILQHGHWHSFALEQSGGRTRICSPALDCGSDWFRDKNGATASPGALAYLLRAGEPSRLTVVKGGLLSRT